MGECWALFYIRRLALTFGVDARGAEFRDVNGDVLALLAKDFVLLRTAIGDLHPPATKQSKAPV